MCTLNHILSTVEAKACRNKTRENRISVLFSAFLLFLTTIIIIIKRVAHVQTVFKGPFLEIQTILTS